MDWTPIIGTYRPVEHDAVRVLTVVHQLGEQPGERTTDGRWFIDTESQLQHLDHLVRHPIDLAYVLMDQVRSRDADLEARLGSLARRVRQLLGATRRRRHRPSLLRPFDSGSWHRWDDALALLSCRGLLRVEALPVETTSAEAPSTEDTSPGHGTGELRYRVTADGARWLQDSVYPNQGDLATSGTYRERCGLLREVLPARLLRPRSHATLGPYLRQTAERLDGYRDDEQIRVEGDLLRRLFQSTFAEDL